MDIHAHYFFIPYPELLCQIDPSPLIMELRVYSLMHRENSLVEYNMLVHFDNTIVTSLCTFVFISFPSCLQGVGFADGEVRVLCGLTLEDRSQPFRLSKGSVTHIAFSEDSIYMASVVSGLFLSTTVCTVTKPSYSLQDSDQTVTVFVLSPQPGAPGVGEEEGGRSQRSWVYLARHRSHYKKMICKYLEKYSIHTI